MKLTILRHWLPEGPPCIKHYTNEDVLKTRHQEQGGILRIPDVDLSRIYMGGDVPCRKD